MDRTTRRLRRRDHRSLLLAMLIVAVGLAGCGGTEPEDTGDVGTPTPDGTNAAELRTVTVADQGALTNLPVNVAQAQGYLADEGLTLEPVPIAAFGEVVAALINGDIDVTIHTPLVISTLNQGDSGVQASYFVNVQAPDINLVASQDVDAPSAAEGDWQDAVAALRGHALGVPALEGIFELIPRALMTEAGVEQDEVDVVATGAGPSALAALENDQVQFIVADSLAATQAEVRGTGSTVLALGAGQGPEGITNTMWVGAIARRDRLDEDPEFFGGFARAIERATAFLSDPANRDAMIEILQEHHGLELDVAEALADRLDSFMVSPEIPEDLWERTTTFWIDNGLGIQSPPPPYDEVVVDVR